MHERVYCRVHWRDPRLVAAEDPINHRKRSHHRRFHECKLLLFLVGCGLLVVGCASDSSEENNQPRHHHHGNGHNRDQTEGVDRSDNSSPTPRPGW